MVYEDRKEMNVVRGDDWFKVTRGEHGRAGPWAIGDYNAEPPGAWVPWGLQEAFSEVLGCYCG